VNPNASLLHSVASSVPSFDGGGHPRPDAAEPGGGGGGGERSTGGVGGSVSLDCAGGSAAAARLRPGRSVGARHEHGPLISEACVAGTKSKFPWNFTNSSLRRRAESPFVAHLNEID